MNPERIKRIQELCLSALELEPADREAYLEDACAHDGGLLEEIVSLLDARDEAALRFDEPVWKSFPPSTPGEDPEVLEREVEPNLPFERLGAFRLIRRLGEGGMGIVYLAVQEPLDREVALKILRPDRAGTYEAEKRFWREIQAASRLRHPGIVTVHETGEEQGVRFFAMELVSGRDLDEVLAEATARGERLAVSQALVWTREIARALACAHEAGIVHRDVKPSNIRVDTEGRVKLMDFGVARHVNLSKMTLTGEFRGTPHYAAPEQVDSRGGAIDARTDVHALGVTPYEMVTGEVPFAGETTAQVFRQILMKDPVPPRRLNPTLSRDLETVILTALAKEPACRYRTASDLADDLDRLMRGEMIHARPGGAVTRWARRIRRNPALSGALGFALLALSALVLSVPWYVVRIKSEQAGAEKEARKANTANEFLEGMFSSPEPGEDGREVRVVDVLGKAAAKLATDFADEPEIEAFLATDDLAFYYLSAGRVSEAAELYREELGILERDGRGEDASGLTCRMRLGRALNSQGIYSEALVPLEEGLEIAERTQPADDPLVLSFLGMCGECLGRMERFEEAEAHLQRAHEALVATRGEGDPELNVVRRNLSGVRQALGEDVAVLAGLHRALTGQLDKPGGGTIDLFYEFMQNYQTTNRLNFVLCDGEALYVFRNTPWDWSSGGTWDHELSYELFDTAWGFFGVKTQQPLANRLPQFTLAYIPRFGLPVELPNFHLGYGQTRVVPADFTTIQAAIDASSNGDVVLVRPGTYPENLDFGGRAVIVRSDADGDPGTFDLAVETTVIDGGGVDTAVTFGSGETALSKLVGLTITNGHDCQGAYQFGGGVWCTGFSCPTLVENRIVQNRAKYGGGISCLEYSSPLIERNVIRDNIADSSGGGVHLGSSRSILSLNIIETNVGGALYTNAQGGGLGIHNSKVKLLGNLIAGNFNFFGHAGAISANASHLVMVSNTVSGNRDSGQTCDGIYLYNQSTLSMVNTILWGNSVNLPYEVVLAGAGSAASFSYSDVESGLAGLHVDPGSQVIWDAPSMTDLDPEFAGGGDYHLDLFSPCIDRGSNRAPYLPDLDLDGRPRVLDAPNPVLPGMIIPLFARTDMGAYEYPGLERSYSCVDPL